MDVHLEIWWLRGTLIFRKKAIELYEENFKSDLKLEKHKVFHRELFNGWALVEFDNDNECEMAPPERSEYLLFYSGSDLDDSFIDWGENYR